MEKYDKRGKPQEEYDNRTNITATVNNTTLGDAAPTGTTAIGSIGMQVGDVPVHMDVPSGIVPGHEGRTHAWHKRTFQELEAKASQRELDEEELKQLLHSKGELKKAAERRKVELLEKRKARTLTPEEAEELQPILDREAAERHARQQAEVDRRKAEAKQLVEEGIAKEKAEEKRKELLRSKQRVGTLTPDERDELQDMLDRDAAQRAAQPAGGGAAAAASAPQHVDPLGDINTNNLTPSDRQKIQEMSDRYIGLPMDKSAKVEQAQQMLAYLKSQLPTDKADQAFQVFAEKGIFYQPQYAFLPVVSLVVPVIAITLEELALLGVSATVLYNAWNIGGIPITDRIRSYFDDAGIDTSEDTFERRRNVGDRSRSAAVPRAGTQSAAAGGGGAPDPDWEPEDDKDDLFEKTENLLGKTDRYKEQLFERPGESKDATSMRAAKLEEAGQKIPKAIERGKNYDHPGKVRPAMRGLVNHIAQIQKRLSHVRIKPLERQLLQEELSKASRLLDQAKEFMGIK